MSILGNLIWILLGGLITSIAWALAGVILCITIVLIPFGLQCFKIAALVLAPFGKEITNNNMGSIGLIGNLLWIVFLGWELAIFHLTFGIILSITIIGLPFGIQHFKLAALSLIPFGSEIR